MIEAKIIMVEIWLFNNITITIIDTNPFKVSEYRKFINRDEAMPIISGKTK